MIILPNGAQATLERQPLTREEIKLVTDFERWCRHRGLVMDLLCEKCLDENKRGESRCVGDNKRDSGIYKITCGHAERVYGVEI